MCNQSETVLGGTLNHWGKKNRRAENASIPNLDLKLINQWSPPVLHQIIAVEAQGYTGSDIIHAVLSLHLHLRFKKNNKKKK